MRKERLYFLLMKPFTRELLLKFYKYGFLLLLISLVSGMIYLTIKYPREYQDYDINTPHPLTERLTDSCITNPEWCYQNTRATVIQHEVSTLRKF